MTKSGSQHKNKDSAFKMLKSKLYELELEKQRASKDSGDKSEIGWGHQIRSYVLQPYQQVKDSRSNLGYSNVDAILDGDITKIMDVGTQTIWPSHAFTLGQLTHHDLASVRISK